MRKLSAIIIFSTLVVLVFAILFSYQKEGEQSRSASRFARPTIGQVKSAIIEDVEKTFLVTRIIDGDTFEIETKQKVRLIGIDTPELNTTNRKAVDCFAEEAKEKLTRLILNKQVKFIKDISQTDRYGRLLRYAYVGDTFINKILIQEGFAYAATFPPDVKYKSVFLVAQQQAKENDEGLWSSCN